jgi:hypothetical protein
LVRAPEQAITVLKKNWLKPDDKNGEKLDEARINLRILRALQTLERIGTAEAKKLVEEAANGETDAPLTREAKLALDRWSAKGARR